ncbi:MAG: hypothetical protein ABSB28_08935 [Candidatus Bathyarchaeia archaeon]
MSTVLQGQETEVWAISPDYLLDQANLLLSYTCMQVTITDSKIYDNSSGKCYLFVPQKCPFPTSGLFTESWMTTVLLPTLEFKDVEVLPLDTSCLVSARRAVESFSADLQTNIENVFYNIENDPDHDPGFIIEILVVIPESNRDVEHEVYVSLGKLMRNNSELLFDLHIVKRRGRLTRQVVPPEFRKVQ